MVGTRDWRARFADLAAGKGTMSTMNGERDKLIDLLASAADRFGELCRHIADPQVRVRRSTWTAADLVAHVAGGVEAYARYLEGDATPVLDVSDVAGGSLAASNAGRLADEPERNISVLLDRADAGLSVLTACASARSVDELVPWHGRQVPLRSLLASAIGELLLHGRDLASTIGASWPIVRREALLVLENIAPLLPVLLDPDTTARLEAAISIRLRGGAMLQLCFDKGTLVVDGGARRCDATVSADPVSFLLVAYGRQSPWSNIMRGRLVAWGRRPWLALRLTSYLVHP